MSIIGLFWMSIIHTVIVLVMVPVTLFVPLLAAWLIWSRPRVALRAPLTRRVMLPLVPVGIMLVWGAALRRPPTGQWNGWQWPGLVAIALFLVALGLACWVWQRAGRDRRTAGLLLLQLCYGMVMAWVVAAAVSAGSGLGAL